jgi:hypothetical protein
MHAHTHMFFTTVFTTDNTQYTLQNAQHRMHQDKEHTHMFFTTVFTTDKEEHHLRGEGGEEGGCNIVGGWVAYCRRVRGIL